MIIDDAFVARFIAEIKVPLVDSDEHTCGTGLPINKNFVLTSRHLFTKDNWDKSRPIKVEFSQLLNEKTQERIYPEPWEAEMVFLADEDKEEQNALDIAIIKFTDNQEIETGLMGSVLSKCLPKEGNSWKSWGFPELAGREFGVVPVSGKFKDPHPELKEIYINVDDKAVDNSSWKGISGAPLVHNGMIYGVLKDHTTTVDNLFRAASVPYLFKHDKKFQEFYKKEISETEDLAELETLKEVFIANVGREFDDSPKFRTQFLKYSNLNASWSGIQIAKEILDSWNSKQALFELENFLEAERGSQTDDGFRKWVGTASILGQWFLLFSLQPQWKEICGLSNIGDLEKKIRVEFMDYIEVVLSRSLGVCPEFNKRGDGTVCPGKKVDPTLLLDSTNKNAPERQLLESIYRDFQRGADLNIIKNKSEDELVSLIQSNVRIYVEKKHFDRKKRGRPKEGQPPIFVYYLIDDSAFNILQDKSNKHLQRLKMDMEGKLQFINVETNLDAKVCKYNAQDLLTSLSNIMNMSGRFGGE